MFCFETDFFLHLAAFLVYFTMFIYLASKGVENNQRKRMLLIALAFSFASIERAIAHNSCVSEKMLVQTENYLKPFWILVTPLCLLVVIGLTKFEKTADSLLTNIAVAVYVLTGSILLWKGSLITYSRVDFGWLINNNGQPAGRIFHFIDMLMTYMALPFIIYAFINGRDRVRRMQAAVVSISAFLAVIGLLICQIFFKNSFLADSADLVCLL